MGWLRVCAEEELPRGRALTRETPGGGPIAVFRAENGLLYALEDRCPHRGAALSRGVVYDICKVACADHGWTIDLRNGQVDPPERGEVRIFPVRTVDGEVVVLVPCLW